MASENYCGKRGTGNDDLFATFTGNSSNSMSAQLKTRTATIYESPSLSPDRVDQGAEAPTPRQPIAQASSVPAFEQEIEVYVPLPPKKIVSVTAVVVGSRATTC